MSTKTFTFEGDGYKFEVVLTLEADGKVTAKVTAVEGSADFNAFFWSDGDDTADFEGFTKKESSLNMNGEGSQYEGEDVLWDGASVNSLPGLGKEGEGKDSFIKEGDDHTFHLNMSAEEFESLEFFGIRATSVNGDDSLKLVGKPEDEEDDCTDHFPDLDKDISYVNFVFKLNEPVDDEPNPAGALDTNGDGYVTVKIEMPGKKEGYTATDCANNLDSWYEAALDEIYKTYPELNGNSTEEGAFIKGGKDLFPDEEYKADNVWDHGASNSIAYFSYNNDPENDPLPVNFMTKDGVLIGSGPDNKDFGYDDGNSVVFDPLWVPEECCLTNDSLV